MMAETLTISAIEQNTTVRLSDYKPHPRNYNRHPDTQIQRIAKSLDKFGQVRSIVVWRDYVLAGHGVRDAALQLGWKELRADVLPDDYSEELALAYVVADNELSRLADPDLEQLVVILEEVKQSDPELVEAAGYDDAELAALVAEVLPPVETTDTEPQIDRAEELREKWQVETGQLWQLGEHRLICGDCTDADVVDRVMDGERAGACITDPPYGINREGIQNDDPDGLRALFDGCLAVMPISDGVLIAFQSPRLEWIWMDAVREAGWKPERLLWMYKPNDETFPWRGWLLTSEAIRLCSRGKAEWLDVHPYQQDCYVYKHDENLGNLEGIHTTMKPLAIVVDLVQRIGGNVFDPFCGSGTTIIACENLGRKCRAIEISPAYVAVALERWADHTGQTPVLVEGG